MSNSTRWSPVRWPGTEVPGHTDNPHAQEPAALPSAVCWSVPWTISSACAAWRCCRRSQRRPRDGRWQSRHGTPRRTARAVEVASVTVMSPASRSPRRTPLALASIWQDHVGAKVDLVLETADGRVLGTEIESRPNSTTGLVPLFHLRGSLRDRFVAGITLYTGDQTVPQLRPAPRSPYPRTSGNSDRTPYLSGRASHIAANAERDVLARHRHPSRRYQRPSSTSTPSESADTTASAHVGFGLGRSGSLSGRWRTRGRVASARPCRTPSAHDTPGAWTSPPM